MHAVILERNKLVGRKVARQLVAVGATATVVEDPGQATAALAPVDASGRPKYASDRKADVRLSDNERPAVRLASDGTKLVLQVRDPFGRLERRHVFDGLARGLAGGEQDRSHGGAGLGLVVCHHASTGLFFDVARGRFTEVTAVLELDLNLRELRTQAKSLHYWSS